MTQSSFDTVWALIACLFSVIGFALGCFLVDKNRDDLGFSWVFFTMMGIWMAAHTMNTMLRRIRKLENTIRDLQPPPPAAVV